ncbi:hypothetical protein FOZ62_030263 [Perkinsus olseni]|uniref:N-acetyltransferase domain-containing protein n=1 Tax=Perkinsus olseni TaxID=32597 RepID=A0A7J6RX48_PEROL|nr:hypothetical protein FOZ62_030263 [Perkinsus olseni]
MAAVLVQFAVDIIPSIALLVNTVACVTARRLLASPPLNTRKPPPSGIIYRDALPGEFGTNAGPEDQSKYFVAVNTTNLNKTIGYIGYSVLPGDRAQKELDFFPLPHIRRDAEIVFVEYIRVGWKSRECGVGTWMLSSFLKHVKNERPKLDAVYLMVGKEHIARRMYENVGFTQLKGTNRSALAYYQYPYTNAAAAAASAAAPAAAPDEHSPTESVNPEEALPGEVSPVVCPGLISNCFIAVNTTNNSNTMVGYIRYLVIQGKNLPGLRRRMKIPTIKEDGEILYVGHVEVLQSSQNHGVATWLLHNFLAHLKKKRPEVEAVYLVVEPDNWIARRVYENNGFEVLTGEELKE